MKPMKILALSLSTAAMTALAACGGNAPDTKTAEAPAAAPSVTLASTASHPRRAEASARDKFRNPSGGGSYTAVLYQDSQGQRAMDRNAAFVEKYVGAEDMGTVAIGAFGPDAAPITAPESLDMLLTFRNVHNWMGRGYADKAFADFYAALKPGGILGLVEHRLPESAVQDPKGRSGYVQESYMKDLAARAGFEFVGSSEVNANPRDTADHPMGVWTLPPRSAVPKEGSDAAKDFDATLYKNIGESDRATLKFRKPL